jgi:lipopolysaccharide transport system ATP-binding protein
MMDAEGDAIRAAILVDGVGVRFDFDRLNRVVTPGLAKLRHVRASAWGIRDVSFDLAPGAGVALVGATGSGKTTLLRVLAGVMPADEGNVEVVGRVGPLLATEVGLQALLTGRENAIMLCVLAGLSLVEARGRIDEVAERSRLENAFDRPIHTYSEGMRARLHLAAIQTVEPEILLLDEVFEALDHEFRAIVERYARDLRARGGIVVAAGHDHPALESLCPQAALLERGELRSFGPFAQVAGAYRASSTAGNEALG